MAALAECACGMGLCEASSAACWYCWSQWMGPSSFGSSEGFSSSGSPIVGSEEGSSSGLSSSCGGSVPGPVPSAGGSSVGGAASGSAEGPGVGSVSGSTVIPGSGGVSAALSETCWGAIIPPASTVAAKACTGMTPNSMTTERAMQRTRFVFFRISQLPFCVK
ncbi:hypothetical protein D3Z39_10045 [Anaerotruncus colihominis]|uniref:Uncharacterized protein n=1 Tax=Anaerotruncus colihominis TaxID=169435 RepID=A0A845RGJ6_9FIRM|nr:hypothetical protein [Anaerotruncus colihominis]